MIKKKYGQDATNVGDEGGFAPNIQVNQSSTLSNDFYLCSCFVHLFKIMVLLIQENKEGLELLNTAIAKAGYTGKVSNIFNHLFVFYFVNSLKLLLGILTSQQLTNLIRFTSYC